MHIEVSMNNALVYFDYVVNVVSSKPIENDEEFFKKLDFTNNLKLFQFEKELIHTEPEKVVELIEFHLRFYKRTNPQANTIHFIYELKKVQLSKLNKQQKDIFLTFIEKHLNPTFADKFNKENPLGNYNLMVKNYRDFLLLVNLDFKNIFNDSKAFSQTGIIRICNWAAKEVELQFLNNFEAFKVLQNKIDIEITDLLSKHELIVKKHDLTNVRVFPKYFIYFQLIQHLHDFYSEFSKLKSMKGNSVKKAKITQIIRFEDLFLDEKFIKISIDVLRELDPPIVNNRGEYIGSNKGYIKIWLDCMRNYKPQPIIINASNVLYAKLLNDKIKNLNLTLNGSELSKVYKKLEVDKESIRNEMITLFSKFSK